MIYAGEMVPQASRSSLLTARIFRLAPPKSEKVLR